MHFDVVAAVFPIIFLGELPDKTMFASLVMSTRGRPGIVWIGAAVGFAVHVVIAVTIGIALFHLLPARVLDVLVAVMFLVGAVLALREAVKERENEAIVEREVASHRRIAVTAFLVIFLAEWGDLTQILTANLAARTHEPLSVGVGAVLALWAVAGLAVVGGQSLLRVVKVETVPRRHRDRAHRPGRVGHLGGHEVTPDGAGAPGMRYEEADVGGTSHEGCRVRRAVGGGAGRGAAPAGPTRWRGGRRVAGFHHFPGSRRDGWPGNAGGGPDLRRWSGPGHAAGPGRAPACGGTGNVL